MRGRGRRDFSLAVAHSLPRRRTLAFSSLAFFKTSKFQKRLRFSFENLAFLFLNKKARLEIASGPNGTPYFIHNVNAWTYFKYFRPIYSAKRSICFLIRANVSWRLKDTRLSNLVFPCFQYYSLSLSRPLSLYLQI